MKKTLIQRLVITFSLFAASLNLILFVLSMIPEFDLFLLFKGFVFFVVPAIITVISVTRRQFNFLNITFVFSIISIALYQEQFQNFIFFMLAVASLSLYSISNLLELLFEKKI